MASSEWTMGHGQSKAVCQDKQQHGVYVDQQTNETGRRRWIICSECRPKNNTSKRWETLWHCLAAPTRLAATYLLYRYLCAARLLTAMCSANYLLLKSLVDCLASPFACRCTHILNFSQFACAFDFLCS